MRIAKRLRGHSYRCNITSRALYGWTLGVYVYPFTIIVKETANLASTAILSLRQENCIVWDSVLLFPWPTHFRTITCNLSSTGLAVFYYFYLSLSCNPVFLFVSLTSYVTFVWFNQSAVFDEYTRHEEMATFRITTSILVVCRKQAFRYNLILYYNNSRTRTVLDEYTRHRLHFATILGAQFSNRPQQLTS